MSLAKFATICFFGLAIAQNDSFVNQTTCNGNTYTYQELAGSGAILGNARDKFGDTIGGIGSAIAMDTTTWTKLGNGSYTGVLWTLPDRGWFVDFLELWKVIGIRGLTNEHTGIQKAHSITKRECINSISFLLQLLMLH